MRSFSKKTVIAVNRKLGWIFTIISVVMLTIGYLMTRLDVDKAITQPMHIYLGYTYAVLIVIHFMLSLGAISFPWRKIWLEPERLWGEWTFTRAVQRISAWVLLLASVLMVGTGLGWNDLLLWRVVSFTPHVQIDQILIIGLVIHVLAGLKSALARNKISLSINGRGYLFISLFLILSALFIDLNLGRSGSTQIEIDYPDSYTDQENTLPRRTGTLRLGYKFSGTSRVFRFDPSKVKTTRPDIFREGYFSVFDVLVHVAERGDIELEYHFDESMNTYVIDELDGVRDWWYEIYYDGGWPESNYYRMDHYPWKDGSELTFFETSPERVHNTLRYFQKELERLERNDGEVIIPFVYISGIYDTWQFENVTVRPHNLRQDMFQNGTITAIDVILSLGDEGKVNYTLQWYESIGDAGVVKSFWVEDLMGDESEGRCGFVHEEGNLFRIDIGGNHIHLPADAKVLNNPDYAWWFYICV